MRFFFLNFLSLLSICSLSQSIDVQHYRFNLELSDENDQLKAMAIVAISFQQETKDFYLNLIQQKPNGRGMKVENVKGKNVNGFQQSNDKLYVTLKNTTAPGTIDTFEIAYSGVPANGLVISKNKFGDRTFFSDNWPDRAQHWIPCNDVLSDKASVEFLVTAPNHYQVVSNGLQIAEAKLENNRKLTHWKEDVPIPTKIMVIGVARFAVQPIGVQDSIPVTAWVYPQNKEKGFYDYEPAAEVLKFFTEYIGPYPFKKLANVQSTTMFGGMENANTIFYDENSVNGKRTVEPTIAHEIAHQWFGDMATEKNFAHLWLSEGFATYLTNIYWEKKYGPPSASERLAEERNKIIKFSRINNHPVVDSVSDFMDLLNANSYQKGGWVLHMLRGEVGEKVLQKIIQEYYRQYKGSNADTRDFQQVAEKVSGKKLGSFFDRWLYQPEIPKIKAQWKVLNKKQYVLTVEQTGKKIFDFWLPMGLQSPDEEIRDFSVHISKEKQDIILDHRVDEMPKIILDPFVLLLFEGTISQSN